METHCCLAHEVPGLRPASVLLVLVWIALHDMHTPATVLAAARQLLAPGGAVLVLEFSSPDNFAEVASSEAAEVAAVRAQARLCLSVSVLHCLPVSKELQPSQVTPPLSITRQLQRCVCVHCAGSGHRALPRHAGAGGGQGGVQQRHLLPRITRHDHVRAQGGPAPASPASQASCRG